MEYIALPEYVKQMRKLYRLTQVDLSEKSGVGLRFVRELEQGKQSLRMDKVNQLLNLFGSELSPAPMDRSKLITE
jgi:y4mF family transcriptional regulator